MRMIPPAILAALVLAVGTMIQAQSGSGVSTQGSTRAVPLREIPAPLRDAWLKFHEDEICLDTESVFVFHPEGMELWCRVKNEGEFRDIQALVEPLRKTFRIDLYPTYAEREQKPSTFEGDNPPPSLWTNAELRSYLRDPFDMLLSGADNMNLFDFKSSRSEDELKRRLNLYCNQIREWATRMWHLAEDLPPLAMAAYSRDAAPETRDRAQRICREHAREVGKYADKLADNLRHAIPRGSGDESESQPSAPAGEAPPTPYEMAAQIASQAQDLQYRIHVFLHPVMHTVTITDLRAPRLIDLLRSLEKAAADFDPDSRKFR
jgi:hypothetical protein